MNKVQLTLEVARWEFTRFYKLKNELIAVGLLIGAGAIAFAAMYLSLRTETDKPEIVLVNEDVIVVDSTIYDYFSVRYADYSEVDAYKEKVENGEIAGLVIISSVDTGELFIRTDRPWMSQLRRLLTGYRHESVISLSDIPTETVEYLLRPFELETVFHDERVRKEQGTERAFAIGFVVLMMAAIFIGLGYQFTAITGEKQLRITEQVVSAISPQTWIDGKILGITAICIVTILFYGTLTLAISLPFAQYFGPGIIESIAHMSVWMFIAFLIMSLLGLIMWNSFFAAVASTINDPNTSGRSALMMLPALPLVFALAALRNPDDTLMVVLGVFPATSPTILPARMVLTDVHAWEFFLAVFLLIGTIWFFKKAASKIFALGMLMYGKEPGLKEMWRWVRET